MVDQVRGSVGQMARRVEVMSTSCRCSRHCDFADWELSALKTENNLESMPGVTNGDTDV